MVMINKIFGGQFINSEWQGGNPGNINKNSNVPNGISAEGDCYVSQSKQESGVPADSFAVRYSDTINRIETYLELWRDNATLPAASSEARNLIGSIVQIENEEERGRLMSEAHQYFLDRRNRYAAEGNTNLRDRYFHIADLFRAALENLP